MAVALETFSPLWVTALRFVVAFVAFVVVLALGSQLRLPARADAPIVLSTALVRLLAVHALTFLGLGHVPPGRSSILVYSAALWTVPMASVVLGEKPDRLRSIGLAVGITGILFLIEPWTFDWSDRDVVVGHALLLTASFLLAGFTVHVRGHRFRSSPLVLMPWECALGALTAAALALWIEGPLYVEWSPGAVANVAYQGAIATGLGIWAVVVMSRAIPAISSNIGQMGIPCVGLLSSVLVLSERVTVAVVAGLLLIMVGVALGAVSDWSPEGVLASAARD